VRGLDLQVKMGEAEDARVSRFERLGTARREKLGGDDFTWDFTAPRGKIHRRGAYLASEPTLAWASSNAHISWWRRAGAMGGGTEAS
jgi:hypothetical protein